MAYITFGSDSVAIEESTQSQPAGWRRTWAKSTAPTAFGGYRVSQSLRMRNGLHSAQEGGEGFPLPSGVHSRAGLQSSQGHRGKGYKEPRAAGRRPAWRGSLHRVAPQPALGWQRDLSPAAVSHKKRRINTYTTSKTGNL